MSTINLNVINNNIKNLLILHLSPKKLRGYIDQLENQQKLPQFFNQVIHNPLISTLISYWGKWFSESQFTVWEKCIESQQNDDDNSGNNLLHNRFNLLEENLIMENLGAWQITFGCSYGCMRCSLDAIRKTRGHISFTRIDQVLNKYKTNFKKNNVFFYWASDVFDYDDTENDEKYSYCDVHNAVVNICKYNPGISTRESQNKMWLDFLAKQGKNRTFSEKNRLSSFGFSKNKLKKLFENYKTGLFLSGVGEKFYDGIGINTLKNKDRIGSIGHGCFDGVLWFADRGFINIIQCAISEQFPQGQIIAPINRIRKGNICAGESLFLVLSETVVIFKEYKARNIVAKLKPYFHIKNQTDEFMITVDDKSLTIVNVIKMNSVDKIELYDFHLSHTFQHEFRKTINDLFFIGVEDNNQNLIKSIFYKNNLFQIKFNNDNETQLVVQLQNNTVFDSIVDEYASYLNKNSKIDSAEFLNRYGQYRFSIHSVDLINKHYKITIYK